MSPGRLVRAFFMFYTLIFIAMENLTQIVKGTHARLTQQKLGLTFFSYFSWLIY